MKNYIRNSMQNSSRILLPVLSAGLLAFTLQSPAAIPSPEKLLPEDTLIMLSVPDVSKLQDIQKHSPQMQLWNDPAMKPFKDDFTAKLQKQIVEPLERDLGIKLEDYTSLLQGQLTFAVTQNGASEKKGAEPGILLLLDTRDKSGQLKTNLDNLRKKWVDSGKPLKTEKLRDTEFMVFPFSENDLPAALKKPFQHTYAGDSEPAETDTNSATTNQLIVGQYESLLLVGTETKPLEQVMVHLTGGSMPTLGGLDAFESDRLNLFRESPLYGWINAKAFLDMLTKSTDSDSGSAGFSLFDPAKIVKALGIGGMKTLAFAFQNSNDGSLIQFAVGVPESERAGLLQLLAVGSKNAAPPAFVPADVMKFQRWRISGKDAWAAIRKAMNDISPQLSQTVDYVLKTANEAAQQKDPNFDIEKNFFGNLGDDFISYAKPPTGNSVAEMASPPALTLIGSPNPDELAASLKSLLIIVSPQAGEPNTREFLGRKIYSVPLPSRGTNGATNATLSYAASSGYVALTTDTSMLEQYLRNSSGEQKPLREKSGLTEAAAKIGGFDTGLFGYENQVETGKISMEMMRKLAGKSDDTNAPESTIAGSMGVPDLGGALKDWVDFSLLPPFEKISKYFYFSVYTGSANVNGLKYQIFAPVPPDLRGSGQ